MTHWWPDINNSRSADTAQHKETRDTENFLQRTGAFPKENTATNSTLVNNTTDTHRDTNTNIIF